MVVVVLKMIVMMVNGFITDDSDGSEWIYI